MGLRIAHNISAMTTHRWLGVSDSGLTKSLERLSSGYRINRAADDAAGLAISQGFRADIASFKVASRNASEASALLQVAEGGIDQIANMLTRLKELATQASSANAGSSERAKIDSEGDALISEIERIANVTMYGSSTLLDGSFGASKTVAMGNGTGADNILSGTTVGYSFTNQSVLSGASMYTLGSAVQEGTWYLGVTTGMLAQTSGNLMLMNNATYSLATIVTSYSGTLTAASSAVVFANLGITMSITGSLSALGTTGVGTISAGAATGTFTASVTFKRTGLSSLNAEGATTGVYTFAAADDQKISLGDGTTTQTIAYAANQTHTFSNLNISFYLSSATEGYDENDLEGFVLTVTSSGSSGSTFQIGAENNADNQIAISIDSVKTSILGIDSLDLSTASAAQTALDLVDSAISTLATSRGEIGASMNRLAYASANLATTIENVQAAESVIRDVDMALEMTEFTKNQILLQAGTAMLAQANMAPQQVLALFG